MKKEFTIIINLLIGSVFLLQLIKPLNDLLLLQDITDINAKLISGLFIRVLLVGILIYLIKIFNLKSFATLQTFKFKNLQAIGIVLIIITVGISSSWNKFHQTDSKTIFLFGISMLIVGIFEELLFRGAILPLLIKAFIKNKNVILMSVFISSILFGIIHYINLFKEPDNFQGVTSQVIFAFAIGIFFSGLFLRTSNIYLVAIIHGLINFAFSGELVNRKSELIISQTVMSEKSWFSIAMNLLFLLFIIAGGLYMIRKTDTDIILKNLNTTTNNT